MRVLRIMRLFRHGAFFRAVFGYQRTVFESIMHVSNEDEKELIERVRRTPKPLFYRRDFLETHIATPSGNPNAATGNATQSLQFILRLVHVHSDEQVVK